MRLIVTRPQREAQQWVTDLAKLGFDAQALPLIEVGPVADSTELVRAWRALPSYAAVMFVSGNAARYFFSAKPALIPEFVERSMSRPRAWAPGPGTARALERAGVARDRIDVPALDTGQFDSEALWRLVSPQVSAGDRILIVRGGDDQGSSTAARGSGREWFAQQLVQAGAQADFVMAYQRRAPAFGPIERALACRAAIDGSVWLFSSAEALANLTSWLPAQDWSEARALATHPRIAAAVKNAGFGLVAESRPTLPEVLAVLQRLDHGAARTHGGR